MVDVDPLLSAGYVIVDASVCQRPASVQRGPAPALSRSAVVPLALCAPWHPFAGEQACYR
jgi:hypothetical protein